MKTLLPLLLSLMLAIGLTACGGSSNSTPEPTPTPQPQPEPEPSTPESISLDLLGRYSSGIFAESAAEITAFDPTHQRILVVNAQAGAVDVIDASNAANPTLITTLDTTEVLENSEVNSLAVHGELIALAIQAPVKTDTGYVAVYRTEDFSLVTQIAVGALPDMVTFTPDGQYLLVANEGEPSDDYTVDPEGSISIIALADLNDIQVATADFHAYNGQESALRAEGVRIFGPGASAAQDFEPEYIAVSADSATAWVTLQENNALARVDIASATVTDILPLGFKDHGMDSNSFASGNALDVSDDDGVIHIQSWPGLYGIFHPDAIATYSAGGLDYIVSANEGDARAWGEDNQAYWDGDTSQGFVEEIRVKHLVHPDGFSRRVGDDMPAQLAALAAGALLNPEVFGYCGATAGDPGDCREDEHLGRLNVTWTMGYRTHADGAPVMFNSDGEEDPEGDRLMFDALYAFGTRSFAIWSADGELIWESGDDFEQYLASDECRLGSDRSVNCASFFNSNHDEGDALESRSDNKGPEPEGVAIGTLGEKTFAFIGLERMGGIMVYDITNPADVRWVDYYNSRDNWLDDPEENLAEVGDLGPEGLTFVSTEDSPTGEALLIVGHEVSGTTTLYQINQQ